MEQFDNTPQPGIISPQNSLERLANQAGLQEAINQENVQNLGGREPENYEEQVMGDFESPIDDEFADFQQADEVPQKKVRKRHNDSKKRISELNEEKKAERKQKEEALIRAEVAEREIQRLNDEVKFLSLSTEKRDLEDKKEEVSTLWAQAHLDGNVEMLKQADDVLRKIQSIEAQKDSQIHDISERYNQYQEKHETEAKQEQEIEELRDNALLEFSDKRELQSPLYEGFLEHHDFLNPYSDNYDGHLVDRIIPIKKDLIQELKLNGQSEDIGTTDYFEELSRRIHENLNPRMRKVKEHHMTNDPRYRDPQYINPQTYHQQPVQQQYEQPYIPNEPAPQQPLAQRQYYPHNPAAQHYQMGVAPVNRAGYGSDYYNDPRNMQLDSLQRDTIRDLLAPSISELSQKVHGRQTDIGEVEHIYKQNLMRRQGGY